MNMSWLKAVSVSLCLLIVVGFLVSCGATIRPTVAGGYDWARVEKICVIGVSELRQSSDISRGLTHHLFEGGFPVVRKDAFSVLDIYDVGRREGADVIAYGTLTKVETYYGYYHGQHGLYYPSKEVEIELQFIETETGRRIWQGTGSLEDSASVADEFIVNRLLAKMVKEILPGRAELQRSSARVPMLKVGQDAPLFAVSDINGNQYALEKELGEKVIVMGFWSIFCEHCKQQIRLLNDIHHLYGSKGVRIIAVSLEGEDMRDRVRSHVNQDGLDFTFLMDKHAYGTYEVADPYKVPGTPALYVIGKSGKIVFARSGHVTPGELSDIIESELEKG